MPSTNHRDFKRILFSVKTELEHQDKIFTGELLDISLKGALITFSDEPSIKLNEECILRIQLPSSEITLLFDSKLVHQENQHYGFQFLSEDDVTIGHLRRLLELHLGDDAEVEHELSFLLSP